MRINKILRKIENNILLQIITCIVLCSIVIISFYIANIIIDFKNSKKYTIVDDIKLINAIEKVNFEDNVLTLEGYAFYLGKDSNNSSISLLLKNLRKKDVVWMDIKKISRPDIQSYYNCEYNYEKSGFIASINYEKLKIKDGYEIIVIIDIIDEKRIAVSTGQYLYDGELIAYNPYEFDYPDLNVKSEILKKVFTEGRLQLYRKDYGMYVYEYQNNLYWIATKDFKFSEDGQTYIPYLIYTSQPQKLPQYLVSYGYENRDFIFENYELKEENTAPYRVAVQNIPNSYAITFISTGTYDKVNKQLIWIDYFQLKH